MAIGLERLAEMQEEILWLCEAAHFLSLGNNARRMTEAAKETSAECVVLNKGPNVGEAVTALRGLLHRMTKHQFKKTARLRALRSW